MASLYEVAYYALCARNQHARLGNTPTQILRPERLASLPAQRPTAMRVLGRNPAPEQLRRVEVEPEALDGAEVQPPDGGQGPTRQNPEDPEGMASGTLKRRILGSGQSTSDPGSEHGSSQNGMSDSSQKSRSNPTSLSEVADETTGTQMSDTQSRENPDSVTDVDAQIQNAAQVFLPALAVETGSRASTLITGGVATSNMVGSGTFQKVVEVGLPVILGIATFMLGERMDNVYVKQSAVGMAIPAADALLNPILNPVESALTGQPGGGNGGGNGQQGMARAGMGYGEFLTEQGGGMGASPGVPAERQLSGGAESGMGIDKSTDIVEESEEGSRFAKVAMDE